VTRCPCKQALGCPELEQDMCVSRRSCSRLGPFGNKLLRQLLPHREVLDALSLTSQVEGVLVVVTRKRVHREPPIPQKILLLGRRNDEGENAVLGQQRADRMKTRAVVFSDDCEKGESERRTGRAVPAPHSKIGSLLSELSPSSHIAKIPNRARATTSPPHGRRESKSLGGAFRTSHPGPLPLSAGSGKRRSGTSGNEGDRPRPQRPTDENGASLRSI
jgi:hypothetical protein